MVARSTWEGTAEHCLVTRTIPDHSMPTIKDVAKLAGVSTATVSATINGTAYVSPLLRERVERAILELGYSTDGIARSLKKGVTSVIGLIVDDMTAPFYTELVDEIEALAYVQGYTVMLCHAGRSVDKERKYLSLLRTHRVDGIIWSPTGRAEDYPAEQFERFPIPIVFVDRVVSTFQSYDSVLLNNRAAGLQATNYLLDLGHRRIAMITGADHLEPGHERRLGFSEAFRKRGIPLDDSLIRNGAFRDAEAFSEFRRLLSEDNSISAVLVGSDQMFIGVMRALNHFGLECPHGISVVTIDDFPLAGVFNPRMTSVRQPVREMAQLSLQLLLRRMTSDKAAEAEHHVLEPTLIVRDSCAPSVPTGLPAGSRLPVAL
jgi:LacI family transcriptional regulator